jgi:hypothetical protein
VGDVRAARELFPATGPAAYFNNEDDIERATSALAAL